MYGARPNRGFQNRFAVRGFDEDVPYTDANPFQDPVDPFRDPSPYAHGRPTPMSQHTPHAAQYDDRRVLTPSPISSSIFHQPTMSRASSVVEQPVGNHDGRYTSLPRIPSPEHREFVSYLQEWERRDAVNDGSRSSGGQGRTRWWQFGSRRSVQLY